MKLFKDNWLVKTSHSYFSLAQKFLFVSVGLIIYRLIKIFYTKSNTFDVKQIDVCNLLGYNRVLRGKNDISLLTLIVILNLIIIAGYYYIFLRLIRFLKNVFENNPFTSENGKHLKVIGMLIVFISYFQNVIRELNNPYYANESVTLLIFAKISALVLCLFDPFLMAGVLLVVIGEIILKATIIKQENDLTI